MAGLLSCFLGLFGCKKPEQAGYKVADIYTGLRQQLLDLKPEAIGLAPSRKDEVWALLMETGYPEAVVTLATVGDGTVSLYFSNGGGIIGAGQHEEPRKACKVLLSVAPEFLKYARQTKDFLLPANGQTHFLFLTSGGIYVATESEDDLGNNKSPLSPLFYKAQDVITEARVADAKTNRRSG